jgi:hypothetical protein
MPGGTEPFGDLASDARLRPGLRFRLRAADQGDRKRRPEKRNRVEENRDRRGQPLHQDARERRACDVKPDRSRYRLPMPAIR